MKSSFDRRRFLSAALAGTALLPWARLSIAAAGARTDGARFALVILRGGMDSLSAVPAVGDPSFAPARGPLASFGADALALDGTFALHPVLAQSHQMYTRGELAVVHAVGLPYRERSHFDAQQVLESGGSRPYELATGWLGRALAASQRRAIAIHTAVPLVLRGSTAVDTWAPSALPEPSADLVMRIERLYAGDPGLAQALARARGLRDDGMPGMDGSMRGMGGGTGGAAGGGRNAAVALAKRAGEFLAQPNGPVAAVLEIGGWDSHANQAAANGALTNNLRTLDAVLAALRESLVAPGAPSAPGAPGAPNAQAPWSRTVIVVATEFGREVAVNGTQGTDHGTGGAALLLGGAVRGGRVIADWPGLAQKDRFEGRDLRTTTDLRAVLKGVLRDHLAVDSATLERDVFPGSAQARPLGDLLRAG